MKKTFYTELSYILGIIILAFGTALMEKADFGMSMVVAPAYILHLKISEFLPFFSFGMAEYSLQAVLLILTVIVMRKIKISYLFSFVTAVLYGFTLDFMMFITSPIPDETFAIRIILFIAGMFFGSVGVALFFETYIPPEAYELIVKEISGKFGFSIGKTKTAYDCISCILSIALSFIFFGLWHFEGVKLGTVICALINGWLIGRISAFIKNHFAIKDKFNLRKLF